MLGSSLANIVAYLDARFLLKFRVEQRVWYIKTLHHFGFTFPYEFGINYFHFYVNFCLLPDDAPHDWLETFYNFPLGHSHFIIYKKFVLGADSMSIYSINDSADWRAHFEAWIRSPKASDERFFNLFIELLPQTKEIIKVPDVLKNYPSVLVKTPYLLNYYLENNQGDYEALLSLAKSALKELSPLQVLEKILHKFRSLETYSQDLRRFCRSCMDYVTNLSEYRFFVGLLESESLDPEFFKDPFLLEESASATGFSMDPDAFSYAKFLIEELGVEPEAFFRQTVYDKYEYYYYYLAYDSQITKYVLQTPLSKKILDNLTYHIFTMPSKEYPTESLRIFLSSGLVTTIPDLEEVPEEYHVSPEALGHIMKYYSSSGYDMGCFFDKIIDRVLELPYLPYRDALGYLEILGRYEHPERSVKYWVNLIWGIFNVSWGYLEIKNFLVTFLDIFSQIPHDIFEHLIPPKKPNETERQQESRAYMEKTVDLYKDLLGYQ